MKRILLLSMVLMIAFSGYVMAQKTVTGSVTGEDDGTPVPGVNVIVKGTSAGTVTDIDGKYQIGVPDDGGILVFSFIGLTTEEVVIGNQSVIDMVMTADIRQLTELVVTALGIKREQKSLGYAVQEVAGDELNRTKEGSFISSLSGKVAGLQIKKSSSIGGSINAIIRGSNSFTGNNQALFVVDGVPISNSNLNTNDQTRGSGGYDYGNAASDIDPESIESISVLKGATAAALYGSDAANGVILITTKKGRTTKGLGVSVSHTTTFSNMDKNTFPEYQREYGAGYGPYYSGGNHPGLSEFDINGDGNDDLVVPSGEDASFGEKFDENLMVYQWDSFYPELDSYMKPRPWVAPGNGADYLFKTGVSNITNINLEGANDKGSFRLGYTRDDRTGIMPNSQVQKNIIDLNSSFNLSDKLTVDGKITYSRIEGKGRYGTGYDSKNVLQSLKQWFQGNVDLKKQEDAYFTTGKNITWNSNDHIDTSPHYFDNPYWVMHENYETDVRNRFFGKFQASYEIADWVSLMGRVGIDSYSDLQEERMAIGSLDQSSYSKYQRTFEQYNTDIILNFDKNITNDISFKGLLGFNIRDTKINSTDASTNGGLVVPGIYALSNSASALSPPTEKDIHRKKYGYYGQASFGFYNILFLDGTLRYDKSSTLPKDNNGYLYPSVSTSFLFGELLNASWLDLGKLRLGFAQVANDAPSYSVNNVYTAADPFNSTPMYYVHDTSKNPELKPESTNEVELGLEFKLLQGRIGGDFSVYKKNTINQILPVQVSPATGYNYKYVNAGEMENKGIEVSLNGSPVRTSDFEWNIGLNWAKNKNTVLSLFEDGDNLLIFSAWSTAINARVGEAYGTITGTDFIYDDASGKRVIGDDGKYMKSASTTEVIGNIQADWHGGINNILTYKNLSFSFLIDIQSGGDVVQYDMAFGQATGIYATTAGLNELGNPQRDAVADGGGVLLDGVTIDGEQNTVRAEAGDYTHPIGFYGGSEGATNADALMIYDASYVKLREVTLNYAIPSSLLGNAFIYGASVGVFARNPWIISKNLPYGDPEYNTSSGNRQGIQNASLPSTNEYGFNLSIKF